MAELAISREGTKTSTMEVVEKDKSRMLKESMDGRKRRLIDRWIDPIPRVRALGNPMTGVVSTQPFPPSLFSTPLPASHRPLCVERPAALPTALFVILYAKKTPI
ncbi:hypothetical protein D9611_006163 [Ephemerocybe angulata]|uniref:Uncharacterized protein n=1 Tax=Ephemerocybe angulata TaxID=980116 RepID=A0A8H5CII3_9AGAR|nr:hypothetical protein D9611_006163 [Tulosesus angulatus]